MIIDEAFFGFSRTGSFKGIKYPTFLDWKDDIVNEESFSILGESFSELRKIKIEGTEVRLRESENILMIEEADSIIQRPKNFVRILMEVHKINKFHKLIYTPLIGDPYLFPVLSLLGISLQDNFISYMDGADKVEYRHTGRMKSDRISIDANSIFIKNLSEDIQTSIKNYTLFDIAEKINLSSKSVEILRILVNEYQKEYETVFPRRTQEIRAVSNISLMRPDILRFQDYISHYYVKPEARTISLFIPCSARKPYSESKSHRRLIEAISDLRGFLHEVIITSPLGLVPREIEETYPAAFYDVPVTGRWSPEEKEMLLRITRNYLDRNKYEKSFALLTEDYMFSAEYLPEGVELIKWDKSNEDSLMQLRNKIGEYVTEHKPTRVKDSIREKIFAICEYQFGSWIIPYISKGKIIKNYNQFMITVDGKPALIYQEDKGKIAINKNFTKPFIDNSKFLVEIDDFKPTANVYSVGVISATPDIRIEDEVVLHNSGIPKGVGTSKMPFEAMMELEKGIAVKVRN